MKPQEASKRESQLLYQLTQSQIELREYLKEGRDFLSSGRAEALEKADQGLTSVLVALHTSRLLILANEQEQEKALTRVSPG